MRKSGNNFFYRAPREQVEILEEMDNLVHQDRLYDSRFCFSSLCLYTFCPNWIYSTPMRVLPATYDCCELLIFQGVPGKTRDDENEVVVPVSNFLCFFSARFKLQKLKDEK